MTRTILINFRKKIDTVDSRLISLIAERLSLSEKIGRIKKKNKMVVENKKREKEVLENWMRQAKKFSLDNRLIKKFLDLLIETAKEKEREI